MEVIFENGIPDKILHSLEVYAVSPVSLWVGELDAFGR